MATGATIRLETRIIGYWQWRADLKAMGYDIARRRMGAALREGAKVMLPVAIDAAPEGTGPARYYKGRAHAPGRLKKSFKIQTRKGRDDRVNVRMGPTRDVFYGRWTEYGTEYISPQAWFQRTFMSMKDQSTARIGSYLKKSVDRWNRKRTKAVP